MEALASLPRAQAIDGVVAFQGLRSVAPAETAVARLEMGAG